MVAVRNAIKPEVEENSTFYSRFRWPSVVAGPSHLSDIYAQMLCGVPGGAVGAKASVAADASGDAIFSDFNAFMPAAGRGEQVSFVGLYCSIGVNATGSDREIDFGGTFQQYGGTYDLQKFLGSATAEVGRAAEIAIAMAVRGYEAALPAIGWHTRTVGDASSLPAGQFDDTSTLLNNMLSPGPRLFRRNLAPEAVGNIYKVDVRDEVEENTALLAMWQTFNNSFIVSGLQPDVNVTIELVNLASKRWDDFINALVQDAE